MYEALNKNETAGTDLLYKESDFLIEMPCSGAIAELNGSIQIASYFFLPNSPGAWLEVTIGKHNTKKKAINGNGRNF